MQAERIEKFMIIFYNKKFLSLILTLFLVFFMTVPAMGGEQPTLNLGMTSGFAVLAGSTITNTGTTIIDGDAGADIGLYPGTSFTGQSDVVTNGAIHLADTVASVAKNDLVIAYDDAVGRTPVTRISAELGGTTLTPGVYDSIDGTFQITGTLTLDGNGELNPVFVFKTSSTLITASDSNVNLINSARYCRTFWQVGSSATLGTYSHFVGHILAMESITANTGATIQGQLLARNGAVTLDNNKITNGFCTTITPIDNDNEQDNNNEQDTDISTPEAEAPIEVITTPEVVTQPEIITTPVVPKQPEVITSPEVITTTVTGGELPNTATPWYNVLLAGLALTIIGSIGWKFSRKHE